jgi:hypothetical protein
MRERARKAAWFQANRSKRVEQMRLRRTGLSSAEFAARLDAQGGACAICRSPNPGGNGSFHLDHDHEFPANQPCGHRGLLCVNCNHGLGKFRDSPDLLLAAADYLNDWAEVIERKCEPLEQEAP